MIEWISVKDRLPAMDDDIVVTFKLENGKRFYCYLKGFYLLEDLKDEDGAKYDYWLKLPEIEEE